MNLSEFSIENLKRIQKVLKIVLDELELQGINRLVSIKIPLKKFEMEGLDYDTVRIVLYKINKGSDIMRIENEYLKQRCEELVDEHGHPQNRQDRLISEAVVGVSEEDLKNYVILRAKNLNIVNKLKEIKEEVGEELKKGTKTYVKEIKRRFEEMNEKQEERGALKKEINGKKPLVISDAIITGLFNEPDFKKLTSKKGCKFSISAYLDEKWLLSDKVLRDVPDCFDIKNDKEAALDLIDDLIKKELNKLERLKWIKIAECDGPIEIIAEEGELGYSYDTRAEWVVWSKFLHYVADEHDKKVLDWDNIFAPQKQKRLLIKFIDEKRTDLEKDTNIILAPKYQGLMRQIRFLDTLELLEKEGLIAINGIKVCDPVCDISGVRSFYVPLPIIYFRLKADVSLTNKFQKAVKEIKGTVDEKPKRINKEVIKQLEEMNEKQEEKETLKKEIIEEIKRGQQPISEIDSPNGKPYTEIKNGKGYFKFYKQGENIEIGNGNTRHFRLLQCLCEPYFGVQKTTEAIFEAIRLPKDKNDNDLLSYSPQRRTKILTLIEYAKKELQKNKKLQGKIRYKFDDRKNNMWLELEE